MKINEILLDCIDKLDCVSERTDQKDKLLREELSIECKWLLIKGKTKKWFKSQIEVAEYIGVSKFTVSDCYAGRGTTLKKNGYTLKRIKVTDGKVCIKH